MLYATQFNFVNLNEKDANIYMEICVSTKYYNNIYDDADERLC